MMLEVNKVNQEENTVNEKEEYLVVFNLEGQFTAYVKAYSVEEAKKTGEGSLVYC